MITVTVRQLPKNELVKLRIDHEDMKIDGFRDWLIKKCPKKFPIPLEYCSIAVNGSAVSDDYQIKDGDEVTILPVLGGG